MKKRCLLFLMILLFMPSVVFAEGPAAGTGDNVQGNNNGAAGQGVECPGWIWELTGDNSPKYNYRLDLVYVPKGNNSKPEIIKTIITKRGDGDPFDKHADTYANYVKQSQDPDTVRVVHSGVVFDFIKMMSEEGKFIDYYFGENSTVKGYDTAKKRYSKIEKYLTTKTRKGGFGVKLKNLNKDSNMEHSTDTNVSYGYRIIIQKLVWFGVNCTKGDEHFTLATRKDVASRKVSGFASNATNPVDLVAKTDNKLIHEIVSSTGKASVEYYTTKDDMGIETGTEKCGCEGPDKKKCDGNSNDCRKKYADWHNGTGLQILWWDHSALLNNQYDYSLDMACTNCSSKNPDSKAMVIQDTTNWKAIEASKNVSGDDECNSKFNEYFYKNDNVYCREEYHVYFPNENNKIKVQLGRYFTLNADKDKLKAIEDGTIPNFAPIKAIKIRTCKGDNESLERFDKKSSGEFNRCGGQITINYSEAKYKLEEKELIGKLDTNGSYSKVENGVLHQKAIFNYTLADNIFRYVRIQDGYSIIGKPSDTNSYRDVKISNLPISMGKNVSSDKKLADLTFRYALPKSDSAYACYDSYSKIRLAYKNKNTYFKCANKDVVDNVYKKYNNNKTDNNEKIEDSACVKLYGSSGLNDKNSDVRKCINERTGNKMGNCFANNKNNNYSCMIAADVCSKETAGKDPYEDMTWDEDTNRCVKKCSHVGNNYYGPDGKKTDKDGYENKCCTKDTYKEMGRDWDEKKNECCPSGSVWSEVSNKCCSPEDYDPETKMCGGKPKICSADTYKDMGREWNENEGVCCPEGQKYDPNTKKCEFPPTDKCVELQCGKNDKPCCVDCHGKAYCGNGSVKNGTDYCPGKPCIASSCTTDDCDIMKEVAAYRVIDPANPFVSQSGGERITGDNWCNNPASGSKYSCLGNSNNKVVDQVINNKINVSESDAMYKVKLDQKTIDKIREYNKNNDYDDFNFTCYDNGACTSDFLKGSQLQSAIGGKCYGAGKDSFYVCSK